MSELKTKTVCGRISQLGWMFFSGQPPFRDGRELVWFRSKNIAVVWPSSEDYGLCCGLEVTSVAEKNAVPARNLTSSGCSKPIVCPISLLSWQTETGKSCTNTKAIGRSRDLAPPRDPTVERKDDSCQPSECGRFFVCAHFPLSRSLPASTDAWQLPNWSWIDHRNDNCYRNTGQIAQLPRELYHQDSKMIRRSLETMATSCSGVTTCLSEGSTECDLTSETCPPCVYALTGGDYSCYSRDTSGECPFSSTYAECDSSSTSTSSKSSSKSSGSTSNTTPTPTTKTPAKTTTTPTEAPTNAPTDAPTETPTPAPETSTTSGNSDSTSSQTGTSDTSTTTKATTAPATSSDSDTTQASQTSASDKGAEKALTSNSTATSGSPAVVNLALIGGAVVLVVIVLAFVARRVVKKKKMAATQEHTVSSGHNSAWSDRTLNTGTSGGNLYSTYSYKDDGSKGNGISMLSDSQASSTYGPGYHGQSGTDQRPTADFANYGEQSKYAENSQYYSDYSVSTGPEMAAAGAAAGAAHYPNNAPPSGAANHFVDVTATTTSMRQSELDSIRSGQQPLTVSQLMPTAIDEDEEEAYATRRKATNQYGVAHPTTYNFQIPTTAGVPPSTRKPQIFAGSTASSMRSDYDIVDPITMQDVEARNTEMLAEDNRYPKFSFESEASSADLYEGDSSEEESDEERLGHGEEHTI